MFITRIRVHDLNGSGLFDAVLRELPDMCDHFTCYPGERMFICSSSKYSAIDYLDELRARRINTEHVVAKML